MKHGISQSALLTARVPRYTSYPPANRFGPAVGAVEARAWLGAVAPGSAVSLYLHVPFCRRLCWFCACRTQGTRTDAPLDRYLDQLGAEIALVRAALPQEVQVSTLHLGGGTPTLLSADRLRRLHGMLRAAFRLSDGAEISVEIDPCEIDADRIDALMEMGLNRASIGVQDFDPGVQAAIGRMQGWEVTREAVEALRARGVGSVNVDLLYGLPHQNAESLLATIGQVESLAPDRLALYGYAHVPWMARRQRLIDEDALPDAAARVELHRLAREKLTEGGYVAVGIDHFALPGDSMAEAARSGRLHRSFQGYTTDAAETLIGIGASAISRFPQGYAQNAAATSDWQDRIAAGTLATVRGYAMTEAERAIAAIIERLMCDGEVDIVACCRANGVPATPFLIRAETAIAEFPEIVALNGTILSVSAMTHARLVAAHFDTGFRDGEGRFSMAS